MAVTQLKIYFAIENKTEIVDITPTTTAEDICIKLCKKLCIGTVARHLFGLRTHGKQIFLMPSATFTEKTREFDLRIRFKVTSIEKLKKIDINAYDYFFHQARLDVLENKIPDLIFDNYRKELVGLGIADMYRVMLENDVSRETIEGDYKKYIPKAVLSRHHFFVKKPIREGLNNIKKSLQDAWYVKEQYLKQLDRMVPEYLAEEYKVMMDDRESIIEVIIKTSQHAEEPGINYTSLSKNDKWHNICSLEDIAFISIRENTVELSRKNGIPIYLFFKKEPEMYSFVSYVDGYYRLSVKWTFNLCRNVITPSLEKLYAMRCHGPVGGEFSYAKLEEKRNNQPGCYIIRESESKYNIYYVDVCLKNSSKPKTFKLERLGSNEFVFHDDLTKYPSIPAIVAAYKNENDAIYLKECLPPSETDKSPLLLCAKEDLSSDIVTEASSMILKDPVFISTQNILVFKDKKCVRWNKNRPKVKVNNEIISINQYNNDLFPDETVRDAKKTCRNPDGDIGGPWCFVETIDKKIVEKQYCDVPYCNEESCMVFTKSSPIYNHYMSFPNDLINFTFGAKLWDPDSYLNSSAKLVLSLYPLPLSSQQINDLAIGVEIFLSNKKSAFTVGVNDIEYVKTLGLLKSNKFIYFSLTWWHNIITLTIEGDKKPLLMADIKNKDTLLNYKMNQFFYFSAIGNNILWEFPFCDVEEQCDVHTTTSVDFQKFFPIRDVMQGQEINFNIRAYHSAYVLLVATPAKDYPQFKIILQREGNITRVLYKPHEKASEAVLHEVFGEIVQYWTWKEFTIHLFGDEFEVFTSKKGLANTFISFKHDDLRLMRWFSIGSDNTIAHWTLYCFPPKEASPPAAYLPECALTRSEIYYNGTQDVTSDGFPCLPWAGQKIMPIDEIDTLFNNVQQKLQVSNYCRDPKDEQKGAFCYVIQQGIIKKQYCRIRKCKSAECKMAGTGNDYIGKMSVTRSNRTCQHWLSPAQMRSLIENEAKAKESPPETPNLLEHNVTSIADMVKHLQALNQYFDDNSCDNKWRCLRGLFERRLIKKSVENVVDNPVKNSDQYANESKSPPHQEEVMKLETELAKNKIINKIVQEEETQTSVYDYIYIHTLAPVFINETLYADMDLLAIKNYCRNPTRDVAGIWCYTTDPNVPIDVCNVRDCDKPEECIIIVMGGSEGGRKTFILPQWKEAGHHGGLRFALKQWNPDRIASLSFEFYPLNPRNETESMRLIIGDDSNERIVLYYNGEIVKSKVFSHIISTGKWDSLWLQIRRGEIMLGFEGVPNSFFEWQHNNISLAFIPTFLNYYSSYYPIGIYLGCTDCHLENVTTSQVTKFYPIYLWRDENPIKADVNELNLKVRGNGTIVIHLFKLPNDHEFIRIFINTNDGYAKIQKYVLGRFGIVSEENNKNFQISTNNWTEINVLFKNNFMKVTTKDYRTLLFYNAGLELIFYFFSVTVEPSDGNNWVTWVANCDPMDIDGPPIDGGWSKWSPWTCTVTCGGGQGYRTRTCSNPRPNIFGHLCEGSPTSTGTCNDFQCGDISPETLIIVREHLRKNFTSLIIMEGDSVLIQNDPDLLTRISNESPESYYEWTLNGLFIEPEIGRIEFSGDDIIIKKAVVKDTGVYVSMLFRINKERVVLKVVSLAVNTKTFRIDTRATREAIFLTHAVVLGYIYTDLRQKWLLNNEIYIDHGVTTLAAVSQQFFSSLNESHTGEWRCVIEQRDLKFKWITNIVKINVKKAPNLYTNLMEDRLTAPLFSWMKTEGRVRAALIFIVLFVIVGVVVGTVVFFKYCTLPNKYDGRGKKNKKRNRRFADKKQNEDGVTLIYRCMWKHAKGKKIEVAMKTLKKEHRDKHLKDMLEAAGQWSLVQSSSIVRLFGVTVSGYLSMILEYIKYGPLDEYLRQNKNKLKEVDLIEASSALANALWHLEDIGIVHGKIRCKKLLVCNHDSREFKVKLGLPSIKTSYEKEELHWIPIECYGKEDLAKTSPAADVWAYGTTLWEIFSYGQKIKSIELNQMRMWYNTGKRLPKPNTCSEDIYELMLSCWEKDPHHRKKPQSIVRDISHLMYQVYGSRRVHNYAQVKPPHRGITTSTSSLASASTVAMDELCKAESMSELNQDVLSTPNMNMARREWHSVENMITFDTLSSDGFSSFLNNFTTSTTLTSGVPSMQSIFELDCNYNVILQGRIGQGFYGEVYKGLLERNYDSKTGPILVAVKKLKKTAVSSSRQDFEREIEIMKALRHPNIVEILGVKNDDETLLVMEYIPHGSLQCYVKIHKEHLSTKQLLLYSLGIAKGMEYLGQRNIVHRDLAARNILVVDENDVKISDFGLAQFINAGDYYVLQTNRDLPIKWYAPESLNEGKFSTKSDVWSYGVTLWEMFSYGEEPKLADESKSGEPEQQQILKLLQDGIRYPCLTQFPRLTYIRVIHPCWAYTPKERPTFTTICKNIEYEIQNETDL